MSAIRFYDPRLGAYCGLSNLHPVPVTVDGRDFATPEHAFQFYRARDPKVGDWLAAAPTPELSAVAGDALTPEETALGWSDIQLAVMERILRAKFAQHAFRALLLSTGDAYLVEWSPEDGEIARFWGEYEGQGDNHLGYLLMRLRAGMRG